jgi:NAD(P)H-dependent flavin oxidoreductase YrpB (nitropropane dioxygenase family)
MKHASDMTWSQVLLAANAPMLTRAALVEGRLDAGILPTGQVTGVIDDLPTVAELIARIMHDAEQTLKRLGASTT